MFDLLKREGAMLEAVPVPLPGRVILFAGPGGVPMVRDSTGAVSAFEGLKGLPGYGFKLTEKGPAPALVVDAGWQTLFAHSFGPGVLGDGDVVEIWAPIVKGAAVSRISVRARIDDGGWVDLFAGLRVGSVADIRLRLTVIGGVLRGVVTACAAALGSGAGMASMLAGEGSGMWAGSQLLLQMPQMVGVIELAINWAAPLPIGVVSMPYFVRVS